MSNFEQDYQFDKEFLLTLIDLARIANDRDCDVLEFDIGTVDGITVTAEIRFKYKEEK